MAFTLPRFTWGWAATASTNRLDFKDNNITFAATLTNGEYLPAEFASEVQRAMRLANTDNQANTCTYSFTTRKFTLTGTSIFQLLLGTGANAASDCNGLLGFAASDETGATTYTSDDAVGSGSSTAFTWAPVDPIAITTPVSAAADGTTATLLGRVPVVSVNRADGGRREYIYYSTDKMYSFQIRYVSTGAEQTSAESLMDWLERGRRFNLQPDATSTNALRLVVADPSAMQRSGFTWFTRAEIDYPEIVCVQSLARV